MAAYFKGSPNKIEIIIFYNNQTDSNISAYPTFTEVQILNTTTVNTTTITIIPDKHSMNPAPGICLPVIVSFCQHNRVPYNFTVFPNYIGHFGQRDAQIDLEVYDAVVDVRCYELAALFLCSVFVPKCGHSGVVVRPCRSLCAGINCNSI